jgi:cation diffusion facilitator family transporter
VEVTGAPAATAAPGRAKNARLIAIRRVLWLTLFLNAVVAVAKLVVGTATGVLSLVADGLHSCLDGSSNVVGLLAITAAGKPPDADHPYGHRKLETVAALGIGGLLVVASWEILLAAWHRLHAGAHPGVAGALGFVVMIGTMAVNGFVSWYEAREGRRWSSDFLIADAAHTRSDLMVSFSVLLALGASRLGWGWVDLAASAFIVAWILRVAWTVIRPALGILSDEARLDPEVIEDVARSIEGVREIHRIRTRGHHDAVFVDLHVQVDPHATVESAHAIAHRVEDALRRTFPQVRDVMTHLEPHGDPPEGLDDEDSVA